MIRQVNDTMSIAIQEDNYSLYKILVIGNRTQKQNKNTTHHKTKNNYT